MKLKVDAHQRGELFRFMETNFYSDKGRELDVQKKKVLWNILTPILNKIGPARDCARWRKFWSDTLLRVRKKIALRQKLSYENQFSEYTEKKKVEFTKEDLEVLRITGGEDKLIKEFRPRNKAKYSNIDSKIYYKQDMPVCIEDSSAGSAEFEVTNQPVSDDYYEFEKYDSKDNSLNSNDNSLNCNGIIQDNNNEVENDDDDDDSNEIINVETNLNLKPIQSSATNLSNEISIENDTNTNHSNYSNNSSRKRRRNYNSMHSHSNNSNSPSIINDSQFIPECVTSFDIIEENDDNNYTLENSKKKNKKNNSNNNLLQDEPITMCNTTMDYSNNFNNLHQIPPPLAPITATTGTNQRITQKQHQQQFIANQMAYNEEMLNVQKETLIEMRKLSEAQLETNQLLKNLILMFGTNSSDMSNINEMPTTSLNDLTNIVIKGEK